MAAQFYSCTPSEVGSMEVGYNPAFQGWRLRLLDCLFSRTWMHCEAFGFATNTKNKNTWKKNGSPCGTVGIRTGSPAGLSVASQKFFGGLRVEVSMGASSGPPTAYIHVQQVLILEPTKVFQPSMVSISEDDDSRTVQLRHVTKEKVHWH